MMVPVSMNSGIASKMTLLVPSNSRCGTTSSGNPVAFSTSSAVTDSAKPTGMPSSSVTSSAATRYT